MSLIDRSHAAVFESPNRIGARHAFSEQRYQVTAKARASALVRISCESLPPGAGCRIHVAGVMNLRGPQARIRFRQGVSGEIDDSVEPDVLDTQLLPAGTTLPLEGPPISRLESVSPLVWISFVDAGETSLSAPICIGRASRDPLHIEPLFEIPVLATVWLTARRLSRHGPILELSGELVFRDGIVMRVALAPDCNRFGTPARSSETFDLHVAARGASLAVAPRRVSAAVRGTPLVSLELRDWDGRPGGEIPVGWLTRLK
jgi:hypothetical protein